MSVKAFLFSLGCMVTWFVFLPVLAVGGSIALFGYAVLAEIGALLFGRTKSVVDPNTARELARRVCVGAGA
jgi:hypothetical protein